MDNREFCSRNGGDSRYINNQLRILATELRQKQNIGAHVSDAQEKIGNPEPTTNSNAGEPNYMTQYQTQGFNGESTGPHLQFPSNSDDHQQPTTSFPFHTDGLSYNRYGSNFWLDSNPSNPTHNPEIQTLNVIQSYPFSLGDDQTTSFADLLPSATAAQPSSHNLYYVVIKGRRVTAQVTSNQEFSIIDGKLVKALNLETHPIPDSKQRAIFTDVGVDTPSQYTTFTCDIPKLGVQGWTIHVQIVDWEDPPALKLGTRFSQRLEREHPKSDTQGANHRLHDARPLTAPPMQSATHNMASPFLHASTLGSPSSMADGAISMQAAGNGTWMRSPTIGQNSLFLNIPERQMGYQNSALALTPDGSSTGWAATSAPSRLFDVNLTGSGRSPCTSFQEITPVDEHLTEGSFCADIEYPQDQAVQAPTEDASDPCWFTPWDTT
ncbi:hypothetical protein QBC43DRAFT_338585 [Cladorrhinum sp. PSN259]|nr:hypothetical protein QBC43DRAFT_338585 [Cladorrhinum sp. PSN259]